MIHSADRRVRENKILETLERRPNKKCDYILLRSEQVLDNTEFRGVVQYAHSVVI